MEVKVITPPAEMPLTLQEVKDFIKVDYTNDDAIITRLIATVTRMAELYTGLSFITQTLQAYFYNEGYELELPYGPHQSISEVTRVNGDGTDEIVPSDQYFYRGLLYYVVRAGNSYKLSSYRCGCGQGSEVKITYVAGFGDASQVPEGIKDAILKEVAELYENRQNTVIGTIIADLSTTTKDILYQYKRNVFV